MPVPMIAILAMAPPRFGLGTERRRIWIRCDPQQPHARISSERSVMRALLTSYLAAALVMGVLDFLWLRTTVDAFYQPALGAVLAEKPNIPAAIAFYLVYL